MKKNFLLASVALVMSMAIFSITSCASVRGTEKFVKNKVTYYLTEIEKGDRILWDIYSYCQNTFSVTIRDDSKIYDSVDKNTYDANLKMLSYGSDFYNGGRNLRIEVEFYNPTVVIKTTNSFEAIKNEQNRIVGYLYYYCLEDGTDGDYNDVTITITACKNSR